MKTWHREKKTILKEIKVKIILLKSSPNWKVLFSKKHQLAILLRIQIHFSKRKLMMSFNLHHLKNLKFVAMNLMLAVSCHPDWRISSIMIKLEKIIKLYKNWIIKLNLKKNNLLTITYNSLIFKNTFKTPQLNFVINNKLSIKWTNKKSYSNINQSPSSNQKKNSYLFKKKRFFRMFKL